VIIEKYYSRLTLDFQTNKRICDEIAIIPSKRLRNKIAGFVTHLMTRIQKGPVRGISLKLQEEERERRMDFVPEVSAVETDVVEVDTETRDMLRALDLANLPGVVLQSASAGRETGRRPYGAGNAAAAGAAGAPRR
jgi:small subunit ribosomal protein S17e